VLTVIVLQEYW